MVALVRGVPDDLRVLGGSTEVAMEKLLLVQRMQWMQRMRRMHRREVDRLPAKRVVHHHLPLEQEPLVFV